MKMQALEISERSYQEFTKLKKIIEAMAGETVSDDQVFDFMVRSLLQSMELPDEEGHGHGHGGGCCCCGGHD